MIIVVKLNLNKINVIHLPNNRVTVMSSLHHVLCIDEIPTKKKKESEKHNNHEESKPTMPTIFWMQEPTHAYRFKRFRKFHSH